MRLIKGSRKDTNTSDIVLWLAFAITLIGLATVFGWQGGELIVFIAYLVLSVLGIIDLLQWSRGNQEVPGMLLLWAATSVAMAGWLLYSDQHMVLLTLAALGPWLAFAALATGRIYRSIVRWHAGRGAASSQFRLAEIYYYGDGVDADLKTAIHWYHLAANQRHARAASSLARLYRRGEGVPKNRDLADEWREVSRAND